MSAPALTVYQNSVNQVSGDGLNTFSSTCNTTAQLRAFIGVPGVQVYMRGFLAPGDGGQGFFYWNATGTGPDDGGITNIIPSGAGSGCWTRISLDSGTGSGTVASFSIFANNGITQTLTNPTTTPTLTLGLGAITPTSINASGTVAGSNLTGTNTGDQTITLTGDVTGAGTGTFAATIAANAVTNAKIRQGVARSIIGVTGNATANVADIQGAANQVLAVNTAGTALSFQTTLDAITIGGTTPAAGTFTTVGTTGITNAANETFTVANKGIVLKQGANGKCGTFICNGVTPVTVSNTSIAITDTIVISLNTVGGTVGAVPHVATITANIGFTTVGTAADTSTYNYVIISNAA